MSGKWRLNDEEVTDERCYDGAPEDGANGGNSWVPPNDWVKVNTRYGAAPRLSLGTYEDLKVGDEATGDEKAFLIKRR